MVFQEPDPMVNNQYNHEGMYETGHPRSNRTRGNNSQGFENDIQSCFGSFKCLGKAFSKIKTWLFALGRGYLYVLIGIIVFAVFPTFLVSELIQNPLVISDRITDKIY